MVVAVSLALHSIGRLETSMVMYLRHSGEPKLVTGWDHCIRTSGWHVQMRCPIAVAPSLNAELVAFGVDHRDPMTFRFVVFCDDAGADLNQLSGTFMHQV